MKVSANLEGQTFVARVANEGNKRLNEISKRRALFGN